MILLRSERYPFRRRVLDEDANVVAIFIAKACYDDVAVGGSVFGPIRAKYVETILFFIVIEKIRIHY